MAKKRRDLDRQFYETFFIVTSAKHDARWCTGMHDAWNIYSHKASLLKKLVSLTIVSCNIITVFGSSVYSLNAHG